MYTVQYMYILLISDDGAPVHLDLAGVRLRGLSHPRPPLEMQFQVLLNFPFYRTSELVNRQE